MASLRMVRFPSAPISPRARALEFSVLPGSGASALSGVEVISGSWSYGLRPRWSPASKGLAWRPAAVGATRDPLGELSARDRTAAHVFGAEHDALGQVTVHVHRERHEIRVVPLRPPHTPHHTNPPPNLPPS